MTTEKDLNTLNLSPTNKDYYQVWSELIETAGKLSERWDPNSTNESDPGIVLLKVLTAIADKLNYNIDKNILEAFMPTAAQAESMKRLCDMLGYHVGYYESATTDATIRYVGNTYTIEDNPERLPDGSDPEKGTGLVIPAFTVLHNEDKSIYYSTTQPATLTNEETLVTVPCIEGQRVLCETSAGSVVTVSNLDFNNRYYLPEIQIAENGIFVYGTAGGQQTVAWKKVNNLNVIPNDTRAYSFGFDSKENRPYLQFPNDVGLLIEDGLQIYYIRTSGAAGNISAKTLAAIEKPTDGAWADYADNEKFVVTNPKAALNGKNPENIEQAYNGFKKTIGTFDTLVTCRDYMNKIYQLVDEQNNELVSNVIVSDIRDDINRAHVLCSFSDYGIVYTEKANNKKPDTIINSSLEDQGIDHFDLVIYPFKAYQRIHDVQDFKNSFTYSDSQMPLISAQLADIKSIAHSYTNPVGKEITCIKNYLQLKARISTINKVNAAEEALILANVKKALFEKFNMRELDFGEEIPYESILKVMENADPKIKSIVLDEPTLYTRFATQEGEYDIASTGGNKTGQELYNKLALRNILAGRIELFKYDSSFKVELGEALYPTNDYSPIYPDTSKQITRIVTECKKDLTPQYSGDAMLTLKANEVVKFRSPSLKTLTPYSAYVNYHLILNQKASEAAEPARFLSIETLWDLPMDQRNEVKATFGDNFIDYLQNQDIFKKNKTDFVQIGEVLPTGLIDSKTVEAELTVLGKSYSDYTELEDAKKLVAEVAPNDPANAAEVAAAERVREVLGGLVRNAEAQLENYNNASRNNCLYHITADADGNETWVKMAGEIKEFTLCDCDEYSATNKSIVFYVVELKNTGNVVGLLAEWARTFTGVPDKDGNFNFATGNTPFKLVEGTVETGTPVFRNIGTNMERLPGKYTDKLRQKFMPATQADISQISAWEAYYWPAPRHRQVIDGEATGLTFELTANGWQQVEIEAGKFTPGFAKTSLGTDVKLAGIQPLEEYQLKENEYLFINYTPASSTATSDQATTTSTQPLNICHGPGTIIKPNAVLTLYDSNTYHAQGAHNWAKTAGFDFSAFTAGQDIEGMYSIGPNEQIDIRDFIEVTLGEPSYMYWILNNTITLSANGDTPPYYNSYTLQDGEYIFYTDKNKLDMAYYGAGTELRIEGTGNRKFSFRNDITQVNLEDVLIHGVSAVPWKMISLENTNYIVLREFQYITLTEGDSFRGLVLNPENGQTKDYLDNEWTLVDASSPCYYSFAGESNNEGGTPLPKLSFSFSNNTSAPKRGSGLGWEARSFLELKTGPDEAQLLNEGNSIFLYSDSESLVSGGITPQKNAQGELIPLAIKTNTTLQSPGGNINLYGSGVTAADVNTALAIKIKVFEDAPIATVSGELDASTTEESNGVTQEFIQSFKNETTSEDLSLYNFNTLWTLISAEDFISNTVAEDDANLYSWVRMHTNVPENHYNIMMLYYQAPATSYEFGQGMGFRFYTYRDTPSILLKNTDSPIIQSFTYNNNTFDIADQNIAITASTYLDTAEEEASENKFGIVIIDNKNVVIRYTDTITGTKFEEKYEYTLDHSTNTINLYEEGAEKTQANVVNTLKASITLQNITETDSLKPSEKFDTVIARGIKFKNLATIEDKQDIIGIYSAESTMNPSDEAKIDKVEIRYDRINLYQNLETYEEVHQGSVPANATIEKFGVSRSSDQADFILMNTWYYTYELDEAKNKIVTLFTDAKKQNQIKSPFTACLDFTDDASGTLNIMNNNISYTLQPEASCSVSAKDACYGDTFFFGEYQAGRFCETLHYDGSVVANDNGQITIKSYNAATDSTKEDICTYSISTDITGNKVVSISADRFLLDSGCDHIRIFNNLSLEQLDDFLSDRHDSAQLFSDYFAKLKWWKKSELGYDVSEEADTNAFGTKEVSSYADLINFHSEENKTSGRKAGSYRKIDGVYFLKPGLNIITFRESGKFEFFPEIDASGALFISDVDSIASNTPDLGLNIDTLDYQCPGTGNDLDDRVSNKIAYKLLYDIREKDPNNEFYYNCPLQSATAIDINLLLTGDEKERLSNTKFWYDPNNINNKFVISQIDADFLEEGLTIAKASKLR